MASPGYPGLYPPNRQCRYRILIHSPFHRLRLRFQSLHLPSQCVFFFFGDGRTPYNCLTLTTLSTQTLRHGPRQRVDQRRAALDAVQPQAVPVGHGRPRRHRRVQVSFSSSSQKVVLPKVGCQVLPSSGSSSKVNRRHQVLPSSGDIRGH